MASRQSIERLLVGREVDGLHRRCRPLVSFLDLGSEGRGGECIADRCLVPGVNGDLLDVQLCAIEGDARDSRSIRGIDGLMIHGLVISVTI